MCDKSTYAFDLLYAIYEEEGVDPAEIPEKILTNNLYGIEIDERAGELAAFALTMKARARQRRFFNKGVKPNICVLENVHFDGNELKDYMDFVGRDLFTAPLQTTLRQFEEADNFGSLIRPDVTDADGMLRILESKNVSGQLFISMTHQKVLQALRQADYLSPKYHVVIANPPYMGGKGMNGRLAAWVKDNYSNSKSDLFAMFIERGLELVPRYGYSAMVTMQSWMFLSSYETTRSKLMAQTSIESMAHMANMVMGIAFGTSATVWKIGGDIRSKGAYCYVEYEDIGEGNKPKEFPPRNERNKHSANQGWLYRASAADFKKIPGSPISYWAPDSVIRAFDHGSFLSDLVHARIALATGDNGQFIRYWSEVSFEKIGLGIQSNSESVESGLKWFPCNKGGDYRKWYGNNDFIVNWFKDGEAVKSLSDPETGRIRSHNYNGDFGFQESLSWSALSSSKLGVRHSPPGFMFVTPGSSAFRKSEKTDLHIVLSLLSSKVADYFLRLISATMNIEVGNVLRIPILEFEKEARRVATNAIALVKDGWDAYETSWDFTSLLLLHPDHRQPTLKATYQKLRAYWWEMTQEMQRLEEENNRIFIEAYGLQDELTPEVPLNEITLTCNPHYRYGVEECEVGSEKWEDMEARLLQDTVKELVSYAVGCMFGRYALDKPGLILANQGETIEDYYKILLTAKNAKDAKEDQENNFSDFSAFRGSIAFPADDDNVIPMLDGDWFTDDIAERFRKFLRVAFGDEHYEANLRFVEQGLNIKGKRNYGIRDYFLKDFYSDHVRRYKKRPIYWLFSSPKGSFNALIYMHRYRPDTVSVVLNDYLREFRTKLTSHKNHLEAVSISASSSQGEKTKALKEIEKITKMIAEMEEYEREVLYPLATEQVEIDLDDGVKVNYPKLGSALKKIPGLDAKED